MIRIYTCKGDGRYRLFAEGHAEKNADGDIVCAGVSALVGTLAAFAETVPECKHMRRHLASGRAFFSCRGGIGTVFDAVVCGLEKIADRYPAHVFLHQELTTNKENRDIISATGESLSHTTKV